MDKFTLNSSTSIKIADSRVKSDGRPDRIFFGVSNDSQLSVWIKLQAASIDNLKEGILLPGKSFWEMPADNIYKGEISAISEIGSPDIVIVEY